MKNNNDLFYTCSLIEDVCDDDYDHVVDRLVEVYTSWMETTTVQLTLVSILKKITNLITALDFMQNEPISDTVRETTFRVYFVGEDNERMEFYDVNFSYIDNETFEEKYVSVPEQGGDTLIPEGMGAPGQLYTISRGKSGMIGAFRLESQMLPGSGKFDKTGLGSDGKAKEAANTAFNFLKANARHISGNISTTAKDYIVNYQDLQGIGMTEKLALPTVIALCSIAIGRPTLSSLAVLGDISIGGTLIKVDELANTLQACADCGAKKVLLPAVSMVDFATVPADLMTAFQLIPYQNAEDAVFKALGVE